MEILKTIWNLKYDAVVVEYLKCLQSENCCSSQLILKIVQLYCDRVIRFHNCTNCWTQMIAY